MKLVTQINVIRHLAYFRLKHICQEQVEADQFFLKQISSGYDEISIIKAPKTELSEILAHLINSSLRLLLCAVTLVENVTK